MTQSGRAPRVPTMSVFGGKADVNWVQRSCQFLTQKGQFSHRLSTQRPAAKTIIVPGRDIDATDHATAFSQEKIWQFATQNSKTRSTPLPTANTSHGGSYDVARQDRRSGRLARRHSRRGFRLLLPHRRACASLDLPCTKIRVPNRHTSTGDHPVRRLERGPVLGPM